MTKKMEKIVETMKDKIDTIAWLYEQKFVDSTYLIEESMRRVEEFNSMKDGMFIYHLISEEDFTETRYTAWDYRNAMINKYLGI